MILESVKFLGEIKVLQLCNRWRKECYARHPFPVFLYLYARLHATVRSTVEPLVVLLISRALCIYCPGSIPIVGEAWYKLPGFFKDETGLWKVVCDSVYEFKEFKTRGTPKKYSGPFTSSKEGLSIGWSNHHQICFLERRFGLEHSNLRPLEYHLF